MTIASIPRRRADASATARRPRTDPPCEDERLRGAATAMNGRGDAAERGDPAVPAGSAGRARPARERVATPERARDGEGDGLDDAVELLGSFTACVP